jgi:phenylacetate-CoA ligase
LAWRIGKALVTGEPLPDSLRAALGTRVPVVLQAYGTAEAGLIGYETAPGSGLALPPGIVVEVCDLDSGAPREDDKIGQVVVTVLRGDLGLVRFGTGDLSAWMAGERGVARLVGVLGRMGEAVKVRGLFLHPRQAAAAMAGVRGVSGYRFVVRRVEHQDALTCDVVAAEGADAAALAAAVRERIRSELRLNAGVEVVASLPVGGKVIVDERDWK